MCQIEDYMREMDLNNAIEDAAREADAERWIRDVPPCPFDPPAAWSPLTGWIKLDEAPF